MGFFDECKNALDLSKLGSSSATCYFLIGKGVVIEGYKKLFELSEEKILLLLGSGERLEVLGEKLEILELAKSEIAIGGKISSIGVK